MKLNGIMAGNSVIQQIGNELTREDSIVKQAASKGNGVLCHHYEKWLLVLLKPFRIALMGLGIGAAIFAVYELTKRFLWLGEQGRGQHEKQAGKIMIYKESIDLD